MDSNKGTMRPLSTVRSGESVKLVSIMGGGNIKTRMASIGLLPGVSFKVVRNMSDGPVVVSVKGASLVLGRGMSHKIMVS